MALQKPFQVYVYAISNHSLEDVKNSASLLTGTLQQLLKLQKEFESSLELARSLDVVLRAFIHYVSWGLPLTSVPSL